MTRVVVTGMGIITALGEDLKSNHESLQSSRSGIGQASHFESHYTGILPFGEVKWSNEELRGETGLVGEMQHTRTCLLAFKAFQEAVADANFSPEDISSWETALVSASTVGGMCLTDELFQDANLRSGGSIFLDSYSCAAHTMKLTRHYQMRGFSDTINTACSSSANAILLGVRLIRSGRFRRAIVGGVDSLAKYTVNGFNALKILSMTPCRPFDRDRDGLNLGEGAAYLVLESADTAVGKRCYAEVAGYGNSNDAFHPSAMSDDAVGAIRSMKEAIDMAGLTPSQIQYVNAHGTGTGNNDVVETYGLTRIFDQIPPYSSTKSYTGHTLGAAGAVEAVFSILSICHSEIYPNLRFQTPIENALVQPVPVFRSEQEVQNVLSNSFGFGGNCTSLVFAKV
jgi:3-oxoacyl-(acyl-carrier-protein) synthase